MYVPFGAYPFHPSVTPSGTSALLVMECGIFLVVLLREFASFTCMVAYTMAPAVSVHLDPTSSRSSSVGIVTSVSVVVGVVVVSVAAPALIPEKF